MSKHAQTTPTVPGVVTPITERAHVQAERAPQPAAARAEAPQGLKLRHLRYFVTVVDTCTFTHAAQRLFIAQPTLSQQIQPVEQIVGTALRHRHRGGVLPTAAGTVLAEAARDGAVGSRSRDEPDPSGGGPGSAAGRACQRTCLIHWQARPPAGCEGQPMPLRSPPPGWIQRSTRISRRSASARPTPGRYEALAANWSAVRPGTGRLGLPRPRTARQARQRGVPPAGRPSGRGDHRPPPVRGRRRHGRGPDRAHPRRAGDDDGRSGGRQCPWCRPWQASAGSSRGRRAG